MARPPQVRFLFRPGYILRGDERPGLVRPAGFLSAGCAVAVYEILGQVGAGAGA
ncbi:hypothetical protein BBP40_008672, partial [Aspergillus hancockii]